MRQAACPVNTLILNLSEASKLPLHPRTSRMVEELLELLNDIAWGRAGQEHIPAIESLSRDLTEASTHDECPRIGGQVQKALSEHHEVFVSHVRTHNCPTGECIRLAPAPCQMACPAVLISRLT